MEDLLVYEIIEKDIVRISNKKIGKLGELVYQDKWSMWVFLPIENFFYKPVHLALILKKLNMLNDYHPFDSKIEKFSLKNIENISVKK